MRIVSIILFIIITLGLVLSGTGFLGGSWSKVEYSDIPTYRVNRDDLVLKVVESGTLQAVNEVSIRSKVHSEVRILEIVEEGTFVKKGELLLELDSANLVEEMAKRELTLANASSEYDMSKENLEVVKSENQTSVRDAEQEVQFASLDVEKYIQGEWPLEKSKSESQITLAEAELLQAEDKLQWTKKLHDKGYATRSELQADTLAMRRKKIELQQAKEALSLSIKYTHPQKITRLRSTLQKKQDELLRIKHRAKSRLVKAERDLRWKQLTQNTRNNELDWVEEQIEFCKVYAPQDGLVIYASPPRNSTQGVMEAGVIISRKKEIIKLPDTSSYKVVVGIHESRIKQVDIGQIAYVTLDAYPNKKFKGVVSKVSILPNKTNWWNPSLKVYSTDVTIEEALPIEVKPGLSTSTEILVDTVPNVLSIPIQAVNNDKDENFVFVKKFAGIERRIVEVGRYNETHIEIKKGLEQGEEILLAKPSGFDLEKQESNNE